MRVELTYGDWGSYNSPTSNERKAELPIGLWFLTKFDHDVIEIGEVMNSYLSPPKHTIYDLRNEMEGTIVKNALDVDYHDANVLSISTIEHVESEADEHAAVNLIKRIQRESSNHLITIPIGFNRTLEADIVAEGIEYFIIERTITNEWRQVEEKDMNKYQYNIPQYAGNALCVITNLDVKFDFRA